MKAYIVAIVAIAGILFLASAMINQANAGHGGGHMGGHFGGGGMGHIGSMGHIGGMGHIGNAHIGHVGGGNMAHFRSGHIGGTHIAGLGGSSGNRWHGGSAWNGNNWHGHNGHGHNHNHFVNDHHRHHFDNRFVGVGIGWWPGYYSAYGYGSCGWLRRQAAITGSPYWWDRYYACVNYDYY
jgi:hypothetical protein